MHARVLQHAMYEKYRLTKSQDLRCLRKGKIEDQGLALDTSAYAGIKLRGGEGTQEKKIIKEKETDEKRARRCAKNRRWPCRMLAISAQQPRTSQVARQGRNTPLKWRENRVTDKVLSWCQFDDVRKNARPSKIPVPASASPFRLSAAVCDVSSIIEISSVNERDYTPGASTGQAL